MGEWVLGTIIGDYIGPAIGRTGGLGFRRFFFEAGGWGKGRVGFKGVWVGGFRD